MPTPQEIEAERQRAENERYRTLFEQGWLDPEIGPKLQELAKKKYPELKLPHEQLAPTLAPIKAENERLSKKLDEVLDVLKKQADDAEKIRNERINADFALGVEKARQQFNLTDDGHKKMLEHMKETGNYSDPMGAAAYIVSQTPPPAPTGPYYGPGDLNFAGSAEENKDYELLHRDPGKYFDSEVRKMLTNPRDYVAKEMGEGYASAAFGR